MKDNNLFKKIITDLKEEDLEWFLYCNKISNQEMNILYNKFKNYQNIKTLLIFLKYNFKSKETIKMIMETKNIEIIDIIYDKYRMFFDDDDYKNFFSIMLNSSGKYLYKYYKNEKNTLKNEYLNKLFELNAFAYLFKLYVEDVNNKEKIFNFLLEHNDIDITFATIVCKENNKDYIKKIENYFIEKKNALSIYKLSKIKGVNKVKLIKISLSKSDMPNVINQLNAEKSLFIEKDLGIVLSKGMVKTAMEDDIYEDRILEIFLSDVNKYERELSIYYDYLINKDLYNKEYLELDKKYTRSKVKKAK